MKVLTIISAIIFIASILFIIVYNIDIINKKILRKVEPKDKATVDGSIQTIVLCIIVISFLVMIGSIVSLGSDTYNDAIYYEKDYDIYSIISEYASKQYEVTVNYNPEQDSSENRLEIVRFKYNDNLYEITLYTNSQEYELKYIAEKYKR